MATKYVPQEREKVVPREEIAKPKLQERGKFVPREEIAKPKFVFRLLEGRHQEGNKTYMKGDLIETDNNLGRCNRSGCKKFERVN